VRLKLDEDTVRRIRERQGLTLAMVAARAGTSKNTVLSAEHGGDIRPTTARKIAEALGVEITDLLGETEHPLAEAPPSQEKLFNNGILAEERRAPTAAELNAVEKLADFCRQLAEFLDVAVRTNMNEDLWQMQYAMTRYMAAMTLPYLEREDLGWLFLTPAAQHIELTQRLEDNARRMEITLGAAETTDAPGTEDAGADVIDLMAARVEQLAS
jgi:transcriptional regulator with XRE-family HTH domain